MAIGRVPGAALLGNLDRQGLNLGFTTNSDTLLQLDFSNFRLGINTATPQQALDVNGNVIVSNGHVYTSANLTYDIGNIDNQWRNVYANTITSTSLVGTLTTSLQPLITSVGTLGALTVSGNIIAQSSVVPTSNIAGNVGYADKWWSAVYANTINATDINGTLLTANQPNITNLANISVDSITIGGSISITGNTTGANIIADRITANVINGVLYTSNQPYISNLGNITVDSISTGGNVVIGGNINGATITANAFIQNGHSVLDTNTSFTVTGDVTGSGLYSNIALTLADTGVTAGIYGSADDEYADRIPKITVDSKGRITNISNVTLTQVGNVTFTDKTISTVGNLILAPSTGYILANNSIITNVANPVSPQDVVTMSYLSDTLSASANILVAGNSLVNLIDNGATDSRLEITLDSELIANITANATTFYNTVNIGNISINDSTISSNGNIYLNAQNTGIVQIIGSDALGIPSGDTSTRPVIAEPGYTRFNTDVNSIEYYDGIEWIVPGASTVTSESIIATGVDTTYTLTSNTNTYGVFVSINGTVQQPITAYLVHDGNQITFTEIPQTSDIIEVRHFASGITVSALVYGDAKVALTTSNVIITGNLLPHANVTFDLGSDEYQWRDLYLSGNTIQIGGGSISVINGALNFTPAGSNTPINLSTDINPALIYSTTSNVTVTDNHVNVAINSSNIASINSTGLAITGNVSATNFNYTNGVSIIDSVNSSISTLTSNAAVQSGLIEDTNTAITTANTAMKGYVDAQDTIISNSVTGANSAIVTANTAMKGYVDANITTVSNSITGANAAIVTANTAMKGYVDAINSTLTSNAAVQAGEIATIQSTYAQLSGAAFSGAISATSLTLSTTPLAITSGGTGGTSATEALNNLFPSGETSGYVLKTSGPGSYYWGAESGASSAIGTTISTSRTYKTATAGQTVFTGLSTYTPGAGQLRIYINGVRQFDSAYTETNSSAVTLSAGVTSGTVLLAEVDGYTDFTSYASDVVVSPVGAVSSTTVQDAIAELDTEKASLSGATFTGNISVPYITGATTFTSNVNISGNLNVTGAQVIFSSNNTQLTDTLLYLGADNTGDVLDVGIVGSFTDAIKYQHTGLVRDATDGTWKLFANVATEPSTTIDFTNATYSNLKIGLLTTTGVTSTGPVSTGNLTAGNTSITGTMSQDGVTGGIVPVGGIIMWSGSIVSIPARWALCDGTNSTPNLRDKFIVGAGSTYAVAATGGSADAIAVSHTHTASSSFTGSAMSAHGHSASSGSSFSGSTLPTHTHVASSVVTDPGHIHELKAGGSSGVTNIGRSNTSLSTSVYAQSAVTGVTVDTTLSSDSAGTPAGSVSTSTSITSASAGTPAGSVSTTVNTAGSSGTNANLPPYYALAYIMRIS